MTKVYDFWPQYEDNSQYECVRLTLRIMKAALRLEAYGNKTTEHRIGSAVHKALIHVVASEEGSGAAHTLYANAKSDNETDDRIAAAQKGS